MILSSEGQLGQSVELLREAISVDPTRARPRWNLGMMLVRTKQVKEGVSQLEIALRLPLKFGEQESKRVASYVQVGAILMKHGQLGPAREHFEQAIELAPDFVPAHMKLGLILLRQGDRGAAAQQFEHVLRIDPTHAPARKQLQNSARHDA